MAKKKVLPAAQGKTVKFSVYLPEDEHRGWTTRLASEGRKQNPVVVEWIREYLSGQKALPEGRALTHKEQAVLDAYRTHREAQVSFDNFIKILKGNRPKC
jgi:hypothetical protein